MKLTKKKVFVAALAICLIAILSMGTLAWFNATDSVDNNFKVATNDTDTDPTFTVDVSETTGDTYYDVLPGDVISKDPKVTNTGDYSQWIRVTVTMTRANHWKDNGGSLAFTDIFEGSTYGLAANVATATEKWLLVEDAVDTNANGDAIWYLYLNEELAPGDEATLFTGVKIEEDFTLDEIMYAGGEFNISVKADAVQRDNTGDNAVEAFDKVEWDCGDDFVDKDD